MRPFEASRPRRPLPAIRRLVAAIVVLLAAESTALAADPTMFEGARAMHALEAIVAQAGHKPRFLSLDITAEGLTAEIQDPADPSRIVTWRVSQPGMLRSLLGTTAVRGRSAEPTLPAGSLAENLFDLDPAELARLPQLAEEALARARLQEPGAVVRMELRRQMQILPTTGVGPPRWPSRSKARESRRRSTPIFRGRSPWPTCARHCASSTSICVPAARISTSWSSRSATPSRISGGSGMWKWKPSR